MAEPTALPAADLRKSSVDHQGGRLGIEDDKAWKGMKAVRWQAGLRGCTMLLALERKGYQYLMLASSAFLHPCFP